MPPVRWKRLLILIISAEFLMGANKCGNAPPFDWHPDLYIADSRTRSIVRKEGGQVQQILCENRKFDQMVCMSNTEIGNAQTAYFELIDQCQVWKSQAAARAATHAFDWVQDFNSDME